ncbi:hypothetical protein BJY16_003222 [Actinoplanes octamycinicus]|uniref:Uncharacterized protein n=1 Tax=Actinoplanes octamycinicus TaxID=135948 RepID=A0A7W7GWV5_9ACTN|nr:hypothetical protein [Actinoplanes octamycinicus]MBB4739763.1 hypothetical protein [Actinoplanes octamycinicus]GIE54948.1 hypothetical protein Aoc01nite_03500 [Actinoplanes octamycinicus]
MSLWLRIRAELRGAWRSVKYDLGRRPAEPADGPDVTSTGLSTFPGSLMEWRTVPPETDARPPRRSVAVTVLCLVAACGAIGSYFLVTRGLSTAFADQTVAAPATAAAPAEPPPPPVQPTARLGAVTHPRSTHPRTTAADPARGPAHQPAQQPAGRPAAAVAEPGATVPGAPARPRRTSTPECDCVTPPVPTPTAPSPVGSTPPPVVPSTSAPAPTASSGSPSASTDPSAGQDGSGDRRRRHRHWQQTG